MNLIQQLRRFADKNGLSFNCIADTRQFDGALKATFTNKKNGAVSSHYIDSEELTNIIDRDEIFDSIIKIVKSKLLEM